MKPNYNIHSVKSVRIPSFSGPYFPAFGLTREKYSDFKKFEGIWSVSADHIPSNFLKAVYTYSVSMRQNSDQRNSENGHFPHSEFCNGTWSYDNNIIDT